MSNCSGRNAEQFWVRTFSRQLALVHRGLSCLHTVSDTPREETSSSVFTRHFEFRLLKFIWKAKSSLCRGCKISTVGWKTVDRSSSSANIGD